MKIILISTSRADLSALRVVAEALGADGHEAELYEVRSPTALSTAYA